LEDHVLADPYHIQASHEASAIPKLVLKHEESFFVSDRAGDFPAHFEGELGFYHEGTRYLRWLEFRLNGARPLLLGAEVSPANDQILVSLTNAALKSGGQTIQPNTIFIDRRLAITGPHLFESFAIESYHDAPCDLTVELIFSADFHDVFEVRGMRRAARGRILGEERDDGMVRILYLGRDAVPRTTRLAFRPTPDLIAVSRAMYRVRLEPGGTARIDLAATAFSGDGPEPPAIPSEGARHRHAADDPMPGETTRIETDNETFNALIARSLVDLRMLLTTTPYGRIPYAGVPWYVTPFGRDSLITALQLLPYHAGVAASTLRFLAAWQGSTRDEFRDEEPGKILHEYRQGEMANCREVPFVPYYGTVDATPLFLVLLAEYARWTDDLALVRELWPAAKAALAWLAHDGDRDGDGYLEYETRSSLGLANQGWKDSEDAVSHADGRLARTPIALVEVQGYAYAALRGASELARLLGDAETAARLRHDATALRERFNRDFWVETDSFLALALDGDKRPCEVVSSNAAHALWSGIVDEGRAPSLVKRLLADDMFSGWGIRTLSSRERRYNPMSYHNGSVWPHDNAIAAAGFSRYRMSSAIVTVASGLFDASRSFEHARLPELFCGFPRQADYGPVSYPVACAPQAWAAGSVLQLLTALIGMAPDATGRRITFHAPVLPPWLRFVELHDLRVGGASLDLAISRGRDGASVELISRRGDIELIVRR
jgi:glycogen debranching enzyme